MKFWTWVLLLMFIAAPAIAETPEPTDWQRLAECLPETGELDGFIREAPEGESGQTAYAFVNYTKAGTGDISEDVSDYGLAITVMISDCAGTEDYLESMMELSGMDLPATITGKYRGKKTLEKNESGIYGCRYTFTVKDRFLVELSSSGKADVFAQLDKLIAAMKLSQLESME